MAPTVLSLLNYIKIKLSDAAGDLSLREAEILLQHVLNKSRSDLYLDLKAPVEKSAEKKINEYVACRARGVPLPYVLESAYFHSQEFTVSPEVLIPRPDTETLIDTIFNFEKNTFLSFIDLGTGSGNIAQTLVSQREGWHGYAIDISLKCLCIARSNCDGRVRLICCDRFSAIKPKKNFDFIVSNPPYISDLEMKKLEPGVIDNEPAIALYGGSDGLDFYRYLAENGGSLIKNGGHIYCEIGYEQADDAQKIFYNHNWEKITVEKDIAGRPRVIIATLRA